MTIKVANMSTGVAGSSTAAEATTNSTTTSQFTSFRIHY